MSVKTINITIDELIEKFKKYNNNEKDIELIRTMLKKNILVKKEYPVMITYYIP